MLATRRHCYLTSAALCVRHHKGRHVRLVHACMPAKALEFTPLSIVVWLLSWPSSIELGLHSQIDAFARSLPCTCLLQALAVHSWLTQYLWQQQEQQGAVVQRAAVTAAALHCSIWRLCWTMHAARAATWCWPTALAWPGNLPHVSFSSSCQPLSASHSYVYMYACAPLHMYTVLISVHGHSGLRLRVPLDKPQHRDNRLRL